MWQVCKQFVPSVVRWLCHSLRSWPLQKLISFVTGTNNWLRRRLKGNASLWMLLKSNPISTLASENSVTPNRNPASGSDFDSDSGYSKVPNFTDTDCGIMPEHFEENFWKKHYRMLQPDRLQAGLVGIMPYANMLCTSLKQNKNNLREIIWICNPSSGLLPISMVFGPTVFSNDRVQ